MDGNQFAIKLIQRSREFAIELADRNYNGMPPLRGDRLLRYLRAQMWREYTLGVEVVAKQMLLVPEEHKDLRVRLSEQMVDEWDHARLFGERVTALGGDARLSSYDPNDGDLALYHAVAHRDSPLEIAVIIQCTNEVVLHEALRRLSALRAQSAIVDDATAGMIRDRILPSDHKPPAAIVDSVTADFIRDRVMPDEGRHIKNGRLLLQRMANDDAVQKHLADVALRHRENLWQAHGQYKKLAASS